MWADLQRRARTNLNFLAHRWDNPLHNDYDTELQGRLWPSSEEFYHPLNPIYSFFFRNYAHLDFYDVVLLKDGAIGILEFFLRFPIPRKNKSLFLVPADLTFLVPAAWRGQVLGYRLRGPAFVPTSRYLFYALMTDSYLSWPLFKGKLASWLKQFDPDAPASALLLHRSEIFDHTWSDRRISMEVTAGLQHHFRRPLEFLTWNETKGLAGKSDVTFVGLDRTHHGTGFCAVEALMMSKAANVMPRGRYGTFRGEKLGEFPLSFQHGLEIFTCDAPDQDFDGFLFEKKLSTYTSSKLPLPIKSNLMALLDERIQPPSPIAFPRASGAAKTK